MAYLLRPQPRQNLAIGGGVIEGEDLGSREGYVEPKLINEVDQEQLQNLEVKVWYENIFNKVVEDTWLFR